jgi:hypothetical protein
VAPITDARPLDRAARSFVNHRIGGHGCRPKFWRRRLSAVAYSGNTSLRQTCAHDAARVTASSVTIRINVFLGRSGVREGTIPGRKNYALVSLDTRRPCRLRRNLPPRGRWSLPFLAALETRTRRFASLGAAMVAASLALRASPSREVLRPMIRGDAIERAIGK